MMRLSNNRTGTILLEVPTGYININDVINSIKEDVSLKQDWRDTLTSNDIFISIVDTTNMTVSLHPDLDTYNIEDC